MTTEEKLNKISELQAQEDSLNAEWRERHSALIPDEIKVAISQLENIYALKVGNVQDEKAALEAEVKAEVLECKKTAKGEYLMALWVKGRSGGWDGAKLEGFALVHPEILKAKKPDGEPTVSFRAVK